MRAILDQDERDLASMFASVLRAECPTTFAHPVKLPGGRQMPAHLWTALAEAGVLGLVIDEQHGGSGGRLSDLGIFSVEAGKVLCPTAIHSTLHAALAIEWL